MKKKVKGSSWRYNAGIARPWLNDEEEPSETSASYNEGEGSQDVAQSFPDPPAPILTPGYAPSFSMGRSYAPPKYDAPVQPPPQVAPSQFDPPKSVDRVVEAPVQQRFAPPAPPAPEPPRPAPATESGNSPLERPHIPTQPTFTPNIPPLPPAPTTQRIAERLAQQRAEGYWQAPPAADQQVPPAAETNSPEIPAQAVVPVQPAPVQAAPPVQPPAPVSPVPVQASSIPVQPAPAPPAPAPATPAYLAPPVLQSPIQSVVEPSASEKKIEPQPRVEPLPSPEPEKPAFTPQSAFVSKPFHPESYFVPQENNSPVPQSQAPAVDPLNREPEARMPVREVVSPTVAEPAKSVAQPSSVEMPKSYRPENRSEYRSEAVTTPRYAAPAQESSFAPATSELPIQTHLPAPPRSPLPPSVQAHREASFVQDDLALKRLAAEQAAQAAEAKAAQELALRAAARSQSLQEKAGEQASNLPARITHGERPSGLSRTFSALRAAMPVVQRLLPLLEGNVVRAVTNLLTPQPPEPVAPPPPVDLVPVQRGLAEIQKQHREFRELIANHNVSLQRVEDQLSHVTTATDRNTREQQELVEEIQQMGKRQGRFSTTVIILLLLSIAANILLFLLFKHIIQ